MENKPHRSLLQDVLTESASQDFRTQVLEETLRCARARKRLRQARNTLGVVSVVVGALIGIWRWQGTANAPVLAGRSDPPVAHSEMMLELKVVQTSAEPPEVASSASPGVKVVATGDLAPGYSEINDDELMTRLQGQSVVLVHRASGKELITGHAPGE